MGPVISSGLDLSDTHFYYGFGGSSGRSEKEKCPDCGSSNIAKEYNPFWGLTAIGVGFLSPERKRCNHCGKTWGHFVFG